MNILLLNAGSSSLKATVMKSADGSVFERDLANWAGSVTRYEYAGSDGKEPSEEFCKEAEAFATGKPCKTPSLTLPAR
jgi:hypothetical protein